MKQRIVFITSQDKKIICERQWSMIPRIGDLVQLIPNNEIVIRAAMPWRVVNVTFVDGGFDISYIQIVVS